MKFYSFDMMRPIGEYEQVLQQRKIDGTAFYNNYHQEFTETLCPACNSEGNFIFYKYGFSHKMCPRCNTMYCSPRPSDALLSLYYTTYRAPEMWTKLLLNAGQQRKILQHTPRVEKIVECIKSFKKDTGGIALDLGAGSGAFAICLKNTDYFHDVITLDISESCVAACWASGLSSTLGTIADIEPDSVDLICINDLIEHVFDPFTLLKDCGRVLRNGGFIAIATPNGEGFDFKILKEQTKNITPPEHLNYFNPYSIQRLLIKSGFTPAIVETPGIFDVEMIRKERELGFPLKLSNEYLDYLFGCDESILANFQKFLSQNGLSSHMLIIARKADFKPSDGYEERHPNSMG